MYRALFAFSSGERNALRFPAGESFLILERSSAHWWLATRCRTGETGYIPATYIEKIPVRHHIYIYIILIFLFIIHHNLESVWIQFIIMIPL